MITNNPVHIFDENGEKSPSAFIPFCDLGGNISILGNRIKGLSIPVCNSFKEKFHKNQLCYEIDVNNFIHKENDTNTLNLGLSFVVDTNINRQIYNNYKAKVSEFVPNIGKTNFCIFLYLIYLIYQIYCIYFSKHFFQR